MKRVYCLIVAFFLQAWASPLCSMLRRASFLRVNAHYINSLIFESFFSRCAFFRSLGASSGKITDPFADTDEFDAFVKHLQLPRNYVDCCEFTRMPTFFDEQRFNAPTVLTDCSAQLIQLDKGQGLFHVFYYEKGASGEFGKAFYPIFSKVSFSCDKRAQQESFLHLVEGVMLVVLNVEYHDLFGLHGFEKTGHGRIQCNKFSEEVFECVYKMLLSGWQVCQREGVFVRLVDNYYKGACCFVRKKITRDDADVYLLQKIIDLFFQAGEVVLSWSSPSNTFGFDFLYIHVQEGALEKANKIFAVSHEGSVEIPEY